VDVLLQLRGMAPLITHNERLQDPLDPFTKAIGAITGKRQKTEADHWDIARLEFFGGLYTDPVISSPEQVDGQAPVVTSSMILRCLQEGAKKYKKGKDVLRGIRPEGFVCPVIYDGTHSPLEMWEQHGDYSIRKGVVVSGRRVTRTRPFFKEWATFCPMVVDETIWDLEALKLAWKYAGLYAGLAEMRPLYGQFEGTVKSDWRKLKTPYPAPEEGFEAAIAYIRLDEGERTDRHAVGSRKK